MLTYTMKLTDEHESQFCPATYDSNEPEYDLIFDLMLLSISVSTRILMYHDQDRITTGKIKQENPHMVFNGRHCCGKIEISNASDPVMTVLLPYFQYTGTNDPKIAWSSEWKVSPIIESAPTENELEYLVPGAKAILTALHNYERSRPYEKEIKFDFGSLYFHPLESSKLFGYARDEFHNIRFATDTMLVSANANSQIMEICHQC